MTYKSKEVKIYWQYLLLLIREPQKLTGMINNAENFPAG